MISGDREHIDSYLRGELSGQARSDFESQLKSDAVLRRETDALLMLLPEIQDAGRIMLKAKLKMIALALPKNYSDYTPSKNGKGPLPAMKAAGKPWLWIAVSTVAIALAAFAVWWFGFRHAHTSEGEGNHENNIPAIRPEDSVKPQGVSPADTLTIPVDSCKEASSSKRKETKGDDAFFLPDSFGKKNKKAAKNNSVPARNGVSSTIGYDTSSFLISGTAEGPELSLHRSPPVLIKDDNPSYRFHYALKDTLYLYGPFKKELLFWKSRAPGLVLHCNGKNYDLKPTKSIVPLKNVEMTASAQK
ncbi:MAG: hypothetical protein FD123_264 [Bacteroidetes bacterium]|nr:MAG: hypothetical protein FD123_264 [Bacteroidota bacterium]